MIKKCTIIIPTRNRSYLLKKLLLNINNDFPSNFFEILICDNNSKDNTFEIVKNFKKKKNFNIKYFKSKKHIQKEQFFQWSILKVKTKFFFLLFDDDIILLNALKKIEIVLNRNLNYDFITFNRGLSFYDKNYPDKNFKKKLIIPRFSEQSYEINSQKLLEKIYFDLEITLETPMVTNTIFKTKEFFKIIKKNKKVFLHGHMGDYNWAIFSLNHSKYFLFIDIPLVVFGQSMLNTTAQLRNGYAFSNEYRSWIDSFTNKNLSKMPLKSFTWFNCIAFTLLDMKKKVKIKFKINYDKYYFIMQKEMSNLLKKKIYHNILNNIKNELSNFKFKFNKNNLTKKIKYKNKIIKDNFLSNFLFNVNMKQKKINCNKINHINARHNKFFLLKKNLLNFIFVFLKIKFMNLSEMFN